MQTETRSRVIAYVASPRVLFSIALSGATLFFAILSYPLFTGMVDLRQDLSTFHLPVRWFYQQCLHQGESFNWMPGMFCGFYLQGIGEAGMYHPLHLLLYGALPFTWAFNLEGVLAYAFLLSGTFLLFRRWTLPAYAALFGAFVFTFCGFCKDEFMHMTAIIAHVPWLLLAIDTALRAKTVRNAAPASLAITALTASQLLLGHPQMVYLSAMVEGLYVLYRLPALASRRILLVLLGAKVLGLLIGAIQILPTLDAAAYSYRASPSFDFRMGWSLRPIFLLQFFSPYLFEQRGAQEVLPYMGAAMAALWIYLALRYRDLGALRSLVAGAALLGVLGLLLALGKYGYVYRLWALLPIVKEFRAAQRHLLWFHLATAIVAAVACVDLWGRVQKGERMPFGRAIMLAIPLCISAIITIGVIGLGGYLCARGLPEYPIVLAPQRNVLIGTGLFAMATGIVWATARGQRLAVPLLIAFTIADLALYGLRHPTWENFRSFVERIEVPPPSPGYRADPDIRPLYVHSCATLKGVPVPQGYCGLTPYSHLDYYNQTSALRLAGVRWRQSRYGGAPELAEAARAGQRWYEMPDPMPRARLVTRAQVSGNLHDDVDRIDIAATALVSTPLELPGGPSGRAAVIEDRPGHIRVTTDAPNRQLLIVNERYHKGWTANVDSRMQAVIPVYGDFIGILLDGGRHEVALRFQPRSFTLGVTLSIAGLVLAAIYHAGLYYAFRLKLKPWSARLIVSLTRVKKGV